ncbi:MAG: MBL fold metallo-hydrolase [Meiothermus sp.]|nr:MBL fold metallo-hydrolase [Meiothermus sp.]
MTVHGLTVGPLQENTYLLVGEDARGVIVDPGDEAERILREVERVGLKPEAILLTHGHFDHVGAIEGLKHLNLSVYLHPQDLALYTMAAESAGRWGIPLAQPTAPTLPLEPGQRLEFGLGLEVLFVPGHSPGHVAFYTPGHLIGGDVLFKGGIGRYDLPSSNAQDLMASLQRLMQLPPETVVYPGHGPRTTIGEERRSNPYLQ